jgi:hypothetical protein
MRRDRREGPEPPGEAPERPPLSAFLERSWGRLLAEGAVGGVVGAVLASVLGAEELRGHFALSGAVAAPAALMLTPVRGSVVYRALRYGLALAVLLTLVVSMTGPGRDRPVGELLLFGALFFGLGALGHGTMAATLDRSPEDGAP